MAAEGRPVRGEKKSNVFAKKKKRVQVTIFKRMRIIQQPQISGMLLTNETVSMRVWGIVNWTKKTQNLTTEDVDKNIWSSQHPHVKKKIRMSSPPHDEPKKKKK
jgi:hypothetical protein